MSAIKATNAILEVLHAGLCTLVVDGGRPHHRSLGIPLGGAADRTALAVGNALVGNEPDAAALEVALAGPTLVADAELACVLSAPRSTFPATAALSGAGKTFTLQPGEVLRIGGTARDARAYFCIRGGLRTPMILDSRSSLQPLRVARSCRVYQGQYIPILYILNRSGRRRRF